MCPEEKCSPSCENARKSVSYKLTVRKTAKMPCLAKFLFFYSRWLLKKQSTKTKEHFSSSKSRFIDRYKSNNRQRPNWKRNLTYTQPHDTLWGLCAWRHGIQISMEAILACHPARSTKWLDCHPKSWELWRIRTGPIVPNRCSLICPKIDRKLRFWTL